MTVKCKDFLDTVNRRITDSKLASPLTTEAYIAGKKVRFVCENEDLANHFTDLIYSCKTVADGKCEFDGDTFKCFYDDLNVYLPNGANNCPGMWFLNDETGYVSIISNNSINGADFSKRTYYYGREITRDIESFNGHPMIIPFTAWAIRNGMFLIHSAAVGMADKGVLIANWSGGGKSTLAVTSMLNGMDFVSDDYVLIDRCGKFCAHPLYNFVCLNPDIRQKLDYNTDVLYLTGEKFQMKTCKAIYGKPMEMKAIVCTNICHADKPRIEKADTGAYVKIVMSTIKQVGRYRDTELIKDISLRLKELPIFEIELSDDLYANSECLKEFIAQNGYER